MEKIAVLLIPALMALVMVRLILLPMRTVCKLAVHSACGFACLWLLNSIAPFTGILLPINAATVAISALLGLPGIGVVALLAVL